MESEVKEENIQPENEESKKEDNKNENSDKTESSIPPTKDINQNEIKENNLLQPQDIDDDSSLSNSAISSSDISENDINTIPTRCEANKSMDVDLFYKQNRHYFIMTEGGTPIYSRYGDEIKICSVLATFSAIITKFVNITNYPNEQLNYIKNEFCLTVFVKIGKIFLIAISNKNDSVSFLHNQLKLLYHQILSVITNDRIHNLEEKPSTCAALLSGTNVLFEQIIEYSSHSISNLIDAYQVLPVEQRNKLNEVCLKFRGDALLTMLITRNAKEILALSKSSVINIVTKDLTLIQCLLMTNDYIRENESWVPICLPGISADGFLQLYCNFLPENQYGILFLTEKQEQKNFSSFTELSRKIYDEIKEKNLLNFIEKSIEIKNNANLIKDEIINNTQEINIEILTDFIKKTFSNNPATKSTVNNTKNDTTTLTNSEILNKSSSLNEAYKLYNSKNAPNKHQSRLISISKTAAKYNKADPLMKMTYGIVQNKNLNQFFSVNLHGFDNMTKEEKYVMKSYIKLWDSYNDLKTTDSFWQIEKDNKMTHGIFVNENFVIFGSFNLFQNNEEIYETFREIAKISKQYESNFFIMLKI